MLLHATPWLGLDVAIPVAQSGPGFRFDLTYVCCVMMFSRMTGRYVTPRAEFFLSMGSVSASNAEFGDAIATFRPFLLRLALLQLQDKAIAEDVVQDTLLAAFEGQARFEGRASLKTWLLSILRHKTLDALRDRKRMRPMAVVAAAGDDEYDLEPFDALFNANNCWAESKDAWTDPETVAERTAFFQVLDACLTRLPPRTSRAFLMREWLEADPDEICRRLSLTPGNLRILLYRARMQLRVCLDLNWERSP